VVLMLLQSCFIIHCCYEIAANVLLIAFCNRWSCDVNFMKEWFLIVVIKLPLMCCSCYDAVNVVLFLLWCLIVNVDGLDGDVCCSCYDVFDGISLNLSVSSQTFARHETNVNRPSKFYLIFMKAIQFWRKKN